MMTAHGTLKRLQNWYRKCRLGTPWASEALSVVAGGVGLIAVLWIVLAPAGFDQRKETLQLAFQIAGGAAVLIGLYFAARRLDLAEQGHVTERFTRAVEHLGSPAIEVRIGGAYALERLIGDSPRDAFTIARIFGAFLRSRAPWTSGVDDSSEVPPQDAQVVAALLGRYNEDGFWVVLDRTNLRRANFEQNDLRTMSFEEANLAWADLSCANASFVNFMGADLSDAQLVLTDLTGALLRDALLSGANLDRALFSEVDLSGADLSKAEGLTQEQIDQARGNASTTLPNGLSRPTAWNAG